MGGNWNHHAAGQQRAVESGQVFRGIVDCQAHPAARLERAFAQQESSHGVGRVGHVAVRVLIVADHDGRVVRTVAGDIEEGCRQPTTL